MTEIPNYRGFNVLLCDGDRIRMKQRRIRNWLKEWNLGHEFWIMPGVEFPITGRDEFDNRIWFSVVKDF